MKIVVFVFFLISSGCTLLQKVQRVDVPQSVAFSRYIMISTCYRTEKVCRDPVAKNLNQANTSVSFVSGVAQSNVSVLEEGLDFVGDITITAKETDFQIDLKIHSGKAEKRVSEKLSFTVKDLNEFSETVVMDKPISFNKGLLRAQLVFGPVLNSTK